MPTKKPDGEIAAQKVQPIKPKRKTASDELVFISRNEDTDSPSYSIVGPQGGNRQIIAQITKLQAQGVEFYPTFNATWGTNFIAPEQVAKINDLPGYRVLEFGTVEEARAHMQESLGQAHHSHRTHRSEEHKTSGRPLPKPDEWMTR